MRTAVVVGNPKPKSRTYQAAVLVAQKLTGLAPDAVIDLADLGAGLLDWGSPEVAAALEQVMGSDLVIFASPTYKSSFTGLLKLFLDRFGGGALGGKPAVALMLGGDLHHSLAPEVFLKPVLSEIGASCPAPGLFILESDYQGSPAIDQWAERARPLLGIGR